MRHTIQDFIEPNKIMYYSRKDMYLKKKYNNKNHYKHSSFTPLRHERKLRW